MAVNERVGQFRDRMRAGGFRSVERWVVDVRTEEFANDAHRQSLAAAQADKRTDDQDFVDAISDAWDAE